jgi:signal transduction histidine kinase
MRPVEVDTSSLTAAARRLVDDFQKESGVPVTFLTGEEPVSVSGRVGMDVLQIIREALNNIHKHAQATHVIFSLEQNDSTLVIAVSDNGKGFRFGGKYSLEELDQLRLGPNSIKQRMRMLGGDLQLESQPGHGTSLRMKIPLY